MEIMEIKMELSRPCSVCGTKRDIIGGFLIECTNCGDKEIELPNAQDYSNYSNENFGI